MERNLIWVHFSNNQASKQAIMDTDQKASMEISLRYSRSNLRTPTGSDGDHGAPEITDRPKKFFFIPQSNQETIYLIPHFLFGNSLPELPVFQSHINEGKYLTANLHRLWNAEDVVAVNVKRKSESPYAVLFIHE